MKLVRIVAFAIAALAASPSSAADGPKWSDWGDDLFTRATAEKRFVILDLEAVWCHWCHVMEKTTYANPQVQELLASKYLPVRVDQDANPDLSSRYGDWGWPATIVFGPDGTEIAKIRGYIEPERMQALLKAIIDDPSPGPSVGEAFEVKPSASAFLSKQAARRTDEEFRRILRRQARRLGREPEISSTPTAWTSRSPAPRPAMPPRSSARGRRWMPRSR